MAKWLKSQDFIKFEIRDQVAYISLNRPEKRNALSPELIQEIHDAMLEADDLTEVRVIVLQGEGQDFCAGYDLGFGSNPANQADSEGKYRTRIGNFDDDVWTMERKMGKMLIIPQVHKTVIAKIHGRALAGGAEMALCCDLLIAADDARIGHPGCRGIGSPPVNYWYFHVGPQWAKRLLLTGDSLAGKDAARLGLVLDSVPADELDEEVHKLAKRIAISDPEIAAAQKRIVNIAMDLSGASMAQTFALEADARAHLSAGPGRQQWRQWVREHGVRKAIKIRDAQYGDEPVRIRFLE